EPTPPQLTAQKGAVAVGDRTREQLAAGDYDGRMETHGQAGRGSVFGPGSQSPLSIHPAYRRASGPRDGSDAPPWLKPLGEATALLDELLATGDPQTRHGRHRDHRAGPALRGG